MATSIVNESAASTMSISDNSASPSGAMETVLDFMNSFEDYCFTDSPIGSENERDNYGSHLNENVSSLPTPMWPSASPSLSTSSSILVGSAEEDCDNFTPHNISNSSNVSVNPYCATPGRPITITNPQSQYTGTGNNVFSNCDDEVESILMEDCTQTDFFLEKSNISTSSSANNCHIDQNRLLYPENEVKSRKANINPVTIYLGNSSSKSNITTEPGRRSYCLGDSSSKNAIAARDNRLKKKKYISDLETTVKHLRSANATLTKEAQMNREAVLKLQQEVAYLRSVIANETVLSSILKNVLNTPGVNVSTSFKCDYETKSKEASSSISLPDSTSMRGTSSLRNKGIKKLNRGSTFPSGRILRSSNRAHHFQRHGIKSQSLPVTTDEDTETNSMHAPVQENSETDSDEGKDNIEDVNTENTTKFPVADKASDEPGGVCLHVSGHSVSLEFCAHCSISAKSSVMNDHSYVKF